MRSTYPFYHGLLSVVGPWWMSMALICTLRPARLARNLSVFRYSGYHVACAILSMGS